MTAERKRDVIEAILELYSEAIEHYMKAVNPAGVFSGRGDRILSLKLDLLRRKFDVLQESELEAILAFCNSTAAKKERRAADLVAARIASVLEGTPPKAAAPPEHLAKARELIEVLGFPATLRKLKTAKELPIDAITNLALDAYGSSLTPTEIDQVIAFHHSSAGRKYGEIARSAGVELTEAM